MFRLIGRAGSSAGRALHHLSKAHARWDVEVSQFILARRKKVLLVALAPVLIVLAVQSATAQPATRLAGGVATSAPASGGRTLPEKVPVLGGSKALIPAIVDSRMFWGSILVGLVAGLITGVIGAGGGYILTPALMSFGVRGIMSVGTDQFHLFAKAIIGTSIHHKLGNVNLRLAVWFLVGSFVGVTLGGELNRAVFRFSPALSDAVISLTYVVVLGLLGMYALADWRRMRRGDGRAGGDGMTGMARYLQALPLRPRVEFDRNVVAGGRSISVYPVILCGLLVGFVASIMGVGGGFLTFPMFVYGMGVSTFTTVGTDVLQIIFTMAYSSIFQYAIYGFVIYTIAMGMLVGSLVGVQLGAMVTRVAKGSQIRILYAMTIFAGFFNRLCALPRKLADLGYISMSRPVSVAIEDVGVVLFFATVALFALWVVWLFVKNLRLLRTDRAGKPIGPGGPIVVDRGKLALGAAGVLSFTVLLVVGLLPLEGGRNLLGRADSFFNQIAKHSADYLGAARERAGNCGLAEVDFAIAPREAVRDEQMRRVISSCGASAAPTADGRTRIRGSLRRLSEAALADAELMYANKAGELEARHAMPATEAIYCWWCVFDGLARRYVQENRPDEADFAKFVSAKTLEPAYNFRGIETRTTKASLLPLLGLMVFYVVYTLWYGMSIMLVCEGFGITARGAGKRAER